MSVHFLLPSSHFALKAFWVLQLLESKVDRGKLAYRPRDGEEVCLTDSISFTFASLNPVAFMLSLLMSLTTCLDDVTEGSFPNLTNSIEVGWWG